MARKESLSGQRYACDRPGCDKHYSRPDHLLRHKLNHDREKVLECDQCDRTFVRQDLLTRHLERHALRGKTLGRWIGKRKQSADSDGEEFADSDSVKEESFATGNTSIDQSFQVDPRMSRNQQQQSQPQNHTYGHGVGPSSALPNASYDSPFAYAPPATQSPHTYGYRELGTSNTGPSPYQSMTGTSQPASLGPPMPYDMLDQSHSSHQYQQQQLHPMYAQQTQSRGGGAGRRNWDGSQQHHQAHQSPHGTTHLPSDATFMTPLPPSHAAIVGISSAPLSYDSIPPDTTALLHSAVSGSSHFPFSAPTTSDDIADYDWLFDGIDPLIPFAGKESEEMLSSRSETSTNRDTHLTDETSDRMAAFEDEEQRHNDEQQSDALHDLAFFAGLQSEIPDEDTFNVDANAHARLLHFLASSSMQELAHSALFSPQALRCYIYLFFIKVNAIYPLIHQPTFNASTADPMLLSAMIVCGAHFADESAHFLAERIGRKLWGAFITFEDFRPARATLALLQAMLLTETFGKVMGTRPQHETAHLFHNFIVTLARRNAVFIPSKFKLPAGPLEDRWRLWCREEEKKRISLYAFMIDAQHATIFRHIPALSSFQIHLHLPCDDDEWRAKSAEEWSVIHAAKAGVEPPSFIAALKATLTPELAPRIGSDSDSFKHLVLLHGLMSVAYDLQWKQPALFAAPAETGESISNWKEKLMVSYRSCMQRLESLPHPLKLMDKATLSLIEWAQIVLHADAVDIQIYAGLPTIMGRFIDHHTFSVARKSCREWAKTEDARIAYWHAGRFLYRSMFEFSSTNDESGESTSSTAGGDGMSTDIGNVERSLHSGFDEHLHEQWLQYLCCLLIWSYEQAMTTFNKSITTAMPQSRPRTGDRDMEMDSNTSSSTNTANNVNLNDANGGSTVTPNTSLQRPTGVPPSSVLAQPVPSFPAPIHKVSRQAKQYLLAVMQSDPSDSKEFFPTPFGSTSVFELVERQCRTSRWEILREASGVLRKLIRERTQSQSQSQAQNASFSSFAKADS